MNAKKYSKRKTINCAQNSKIIHFFKSGMKEAVFAAVFMFELNLVQIFELENDQGQLGLNLGHNFFEGFSSTRCYTLFQAAILYNIKENQ